MKPTLLASMRPLTPLKPAIHRIRELGQRFAGGGRVQLHRLNRRLKYRTPTVRTTARDISELRHRGYLVVRQAIAPSIVRAIAADLERHLDSALNLNPISRDSQRRPGAVDGPREFLSRAEAQLGQEYLRWQTNYVSVNNPIVTCPSVIEAAFHERLIDLATGYFRCLPAIGSINLRKSYANGIPPFDTLLFHCDGNSPDFLKAFVYLNDVSELGGPFCYVQGSHRNRIKNWRSKQRWSDEEISAHYGDSNIVRLTATVGDVIIANTTGFHRGLKPMDSDRGMLTIDFGVHPEFWGKRPRFNIHKSAMERLSQRQRPVADFLEVIPDGLCPFVNRFGA